MGHGGTSATRVTRALWLFGDAGCERSRADAEFGSGQFRPVLAAIVAVGLSVRVTDVLLSSHQLPFGDGLFYHLQANFLSKGHWFVYPWTAIYGTFTPSAQHPPLFTLVLAAVSMAGGNSVLAHQLTCAVIGALAVGAIGLLGREVGGPRVGLVSAGIAALYPGLWGADFQVMSEDLYALTIALILLGAYRFWNRPTRARAAVFGAVVGLATLVRPEAAFLIILIGLPLVLRVPRALTRERLTAIATLAVCAGLVVSPWIWRNVVTFPKPVLLSENGESVIGGANCHRTYYGPQLGSWGCPLVHLPSEESASGAEQLHRGIAYATAHVFRLPVVAAARVGRTWEVFQPLQNAKLDGRPVGVRVFAWLTFWLLQIGAAFGALRLARSRRLLEPLLAAGVLVVITVVASYGLVRLRIPWDVASVVLTAVAIEPRLRFRRSVSSDGSTTVPLRSTATAT
jgi:4-amino-4-deoxy-L-arabinose transferase-like glycosyltransferase